MRSAKQVRRKAVQIAGDNLSTKVLCDDGSIWVIRFGDREWKALEPIPQREIDPLRKTVKGEGHPAVKSEDDE